MTIEQLQQQLDGVAGSINRIVTGLSNELMSAAQRIVQLEAQVAALSKTAEPIPETPDT